jgi:RHS repeat-associated protein
LLPTANLTKLFSLGLKALPASLKIRFVFTEGTHKTDTLREYFTPTRERYLTTQHERDTETGYDNRGARLYDADVMRFLSVDPLATKFLAWNPYQYATANPVNVIDPDGKDTIFVNRGALLENYSDALTNVWEMSITYMKDGIETPLNLDGHAQLYMIGAVVGDAQGDGFNFLKTGDYKLSDTRMRKYLTWTETFQVGNTEIFLHRGWNAGWFGGCKGICSGIDPQGMYWKGKRYAQGVNGERGLVHSLNALYQQHKKNLTGDKIVLRVRNGSNQEYSPVKPSNRESIISRDRERRRQLQNILFWNSDSLDTYYQN